MRRTSGGVTRARVRRRACDEDGRSSSPAGKRDECSGGCSARMRRTHAGRLHAGRLHAGRLRIGRQRRQGPSARIRARRHRSADLLGVSRCLFEGEVLMASPWRQPQGRARGGHHEREPAGRSRPPDCVAHAAGVPRAAAQHRVVVAHVAHPGQRAQRGRHAQAAQEDRLHDRGTHRGGARPVQGRPADVSVLPGQRAAPSAARELR
jgi:hypothetical protein